MQAKPLSYPTWVNWIAQDEDGRRWGYSVEPLRHDHGWYENEVGNYILLEKGKTNNEWAFSLRKA